MEVPKEEWPQAIVCASDTMAFFCMDYLKEMGLSIPEDIIVTGFDGIKDCELCTPKLTTVRRAFTTAGKRAVEMLQRLWAGQPVEKDVYVEAELLPSESCGCIKRIQGNENYTKRFDFQNRFMEFNAYILEMDSNFGNVDDSTKLYQGTLRGADFFHLKQMFLCLCTDLENQNVMLEQLEHNSISSELTEQMVSMAQFGHEVPVGTLFDRKNLLPIDFLQGEKAVLYAFSPLYFKDYFLGYMAYQPSSTQGQAGDLFATWILQIANNAGSFYMQKELRYAADKLENLYERDPLTGVFNRRGLQHNKRVVAKAHQRDELVTVVAADVDNLKKVNDAYGHEGGDTIIIRSAMALTQAFPEDAVCVRTGGDEFCVYFSHDEDTSVEQMIQKVDHYLEDFNQHSGLPYQAGCSCGYCTGRVTDVSELDELQRIADENMYKVKLAKKAVRV
jgi:diguanylate cyclase (GGDEF)-like protein